MEGIGLQTRKFRAVFANVKHCPHVASVSPKIECFSNSNSPKHTEKQRGSDPSSKYLSGMYTLNLMLIILIGDGGLEEW